MQAATVIGRDIYLRHTDTRGLAYVQCHRVWDAEIFISTQQRDAERLNAEAKAAGAPAKAKVEQITHTDYLNERTVR